MTKDNDNAKDESFINHVCLIMEDVSTKFYTDCDIFVIVSDEYDDCYVLLGRLELSPRGPWWKLKLSLCLASLTQPM